MAYTTINKSTDYFNTKLYTGNGGTQSITGVGFQPDFTWIKSRTSTKDHMVFDAVRGVQKSIRTNQTLAEDTSTEYLSTFDTDGFTLGGNGKVNGGSTNYASWNWKAGTGQGSSNTDGSINTTYTSANTTAGFSIVKWTGTGANATIGHGLASVPKFIMVKNLSTTSNWITYNSYNGNTDYMYLNQNGASSSTVQAWNNTSPTSSVISLGISSEVNGSGNDMIAYCFAEKTGYSKFGSYTGNVNVDGTFVYTGFAPSFLIIKRTAGTQNWYMWDNKRLGYNPDNNHLQANGSDAEGTADTLDILSNGFKIRESGSGTNSGTFIYIAFGQSLVGSNNVPCTAR